MKKFILLLTLIFPPSLGLAQNTHTLTATDFSFSPDTLYIQAGDTVDVIIGGYHGATEIDSIDWVNNIDNHNGGFDVGFGTGSPNTKFTIDSVGTYYNICGPHAGMGMKSIIIVESTNVSIHNLNLSQDVDIYPNPASKLITIQNSSSVKILNIKGEKLLEKNNLADFEEINISLLPQGVYFIMLDRSIQKLIIK